MSYRIAYLAVGLTISWQAFAGEVTGTITLKGTPPPEIEIKMDVTCGKLNADKVTTRHYVVGKNNGLKDVFVYIKEGAKPTPAKGDGPVIDQKGCMYEPYIWGVQTGQKFKFKNSDPLLHNIHATPQVNKEFNFGQPLKGQVTEQTFDKSEVLVRIKCDVHPWMFTYAGVVDHPYFCVSDENGAYKIPDLPPGKYVIEALHRKAGSVTQEFSVGADEKKTIDLSLSVP